MQTDDKKWFIAFCHTEDIGKPQHAIIDSEGFTIIGATFMTEQTAREVVESHNQKIQ